PLPLSELPTLVDMYKQLLDRSGSLLAEAAKPLSEGEMTLVHCTAGKDRTGVFVALMLELAGVDRETIVHDYSLTDTYFEPLRERFRDHARERGVDMEHYEHMISCQPEYMEEFLDYLQEEYGGAAAYFKAQGMPDDEIAKLKDALTD